MWCNLNRNTGVFWLEKIFIVAKFVPKVVTKGPYFAANTPVDTVFYSVAAVFANEFMVFGFNTFLTFDHTACLLSNSFTLTALIVQFAVSVSRLSLNIHRLVPSRS